jgi:hypothetical protein
MQSPQRHSPTLVHARFGPRDGVASAALAPALVSAWPAQRGGGAGTFCCGDVVPAHVIRLRLVLETLPALVRGFRHGSDAPLLRALALWTKTAALRDGDENAGRRGNAQIWPRWICSRPGAEADQHTDTDMRAYTRGDRGSLARRPTSRLPPPTHLARPAARGTRATRFQGAARRARARACHAAPAHTPYPSPLARVRPCAPPQRAGRAAAEAAGAGEGGTAAGGA